MTKAVVRAMDTVEAFMMSEAGGKLKVNEFVVAGGSKRGWTTWMTAAVDKRVIAIAPLVIDRAEYGRLDASSFRCLWILGAGDLGVR